MSKNNNSGGQIPSQNQNVQDKVKTVQEQISKPTKPWFSANTSQGALVKKGHDPLESLERKIK